jgi:AP-1 complex subunit gamma-1
MSIKLRDLIRAVRACKTAAEERAVISKESALIRTAIKEEDEQYRHRNVAKLMFIHMLGYPTQFGQMECLKLISAQSFPEKRIGYLALTLLLNESAEVLTLVTNSLKLDLTNNNQYIQALSLIAIGNLATQDMARDLVSDVEKLLRSNNSYLRKKAALAAIRLLKKEPDLIEGMEERIVALLKDRSHGVLITGLQLVIEVLSELPSTKSEYVKLVPSLVRLLRNFLSMGYSPEHDVSGITDPFMQVKLLRLLRILGAGNEEASEQMNDVLAQVATNTETSKNAGNAILYECVQTIMDVESDSSLRVLAVNILGRFLLNRDNNIRYVALNSLTKVVTEDNAAVQRHRNTIVDCLKDPDISIRQRALDLIYQLVNESNVVALTTELLNYLVVAQSEQKVNLASKIIQIVEKYAPNKRWRIDTIITMLTIAGPISDESIARTCILFVAAAEGLQGYATHRLYRALLEDTDQFGLLQVAIWCIGEYGNLLVRDCPPPDNDASLGSFSAAGEVEVVKLLDKCAKLHNADIPTKSLVLNAFVKLSLRFSATVRPMITDLIKPYRHSMSLELQQRSTEYTVLLENRWEGLRREVLDKMPVLDENALRKVRGELEPDSPSPSMKASTSAAPTTIVPVGSDIFGGGGVVKPLGAAAAPSGGASLLDFDDIFGGSAAPAAVTPAAAPAAAKPSSTADLLNDIFSAPLPTPAPAPAYNASPFAPMPPVNNTPMNNNAAIDLLSATLLNTNFGAPAPSPMPMAPMAPMPMTVPAVAAMPPMTATPAVVPIIATNPTQQCQLTAFEKNGLQVFMDVTKPNPADLSNTRILCKFHNQTGMPFENFVFQVKLLYFLQLYIYFLV